MEDPEMIALLKLLKEFKDKYCGRDVEEQDRAEIEMINNQINEYHRAMRQRYYH